MVRVVAFSCVAVVAALALLLGSEASAGNKAARNQMVKGTIKVVDPSKNLLIVNQKLKNEVVDRELSITEDTEFVLKVGKETKEASGTAGLELLQDQVGAPVRIRCDKDVNVLKVTVTAKRK
jgi:hypothetical protein